MITQAATQAVENAHRLEREYRTLSNIRPRIPAYHVAKNSLQRARTYLRKSGIVQCVTCAGMGTVATRIAPLVRRCDWCDGSGFDEKSDAVCWKCDGARVLATDQYSRSVCHSCNGTRVQSS